MNSQDNEFQALRRLLALKRHEQPPPGYFDRLAASIRSQLAAEQAREPWWSRLFTRWEIRPAWAGAFAAMVAGLYVVSVGLSTNPEGSGTAHTPTDWALGTFATGESRAGLAPGLGLGGIGMEKTLMPTVESFQSASNREHTGEWVLPAGFSVGQP
ncbi:MAG: hypothetical protein IPM17_17065 [Verrucomicrobia bacterium]|nr:hypothetical protein [Verrucomicrobiota bacterium]